MHINEVWGLCPGAQGALWDPEWRGFCAGASSAKLQPTSRHRPLTGLGDPGPLILLCDTLIVGFQSMLFVFKMQGRGRWRASLSAGSMYWGGGCGISHTSDTTPHRLPPLPKHLAATVAILICSQIMLYAGCWMDGWHHRPTTSEPRHVGPSSTFSCMALMLPARCSPQTCDRASTRNT